MGAIKTTMFNFSIFKNLFEDLNLSLNFGNPKELGVEISYHPSQNVNHRNLELTNTGGESLTNISFCIKEMVYLPDPKVRFESFWPKQFYDTYESIRIVHANSLTVLKPHQSKYTYLPTLGIPDPKYFVVSVEAKGAISGKPVYKEKRFESV